MHFLKFGRRLTDDALNRVADHVHRRHPDAIPVFWNGTFEQIHADCQLWVVGHGSNDGFLTETTAAKSPRFSAASFASLLQAKQLPKAYRIRIKLSQCWGGKYIGDGSAHAQAHSQDWSFAKKLAQMLNKPPFDYKRVQVGGFESEAHWMFKGTSKSTGRKSFTAPSLEGDTHLSRVWYDHTGMAIAKADDRDANEAVFVYFPFDFTTSVGFQ
ncbi:MAG: hypothetical protein V4813_17735 [Gemmatimonadota bacterium]